MAGCIITALIGIGSVVWYGWGPLDDEDVEDEIQRKMEQKQSKVSLAKKIFGKK